MTNQTSKPPDWVVSDTLLQFFTAIRDERDRGCVLLAAAYIDKALASLLRAKLKAMSGADDRLLRKLLKGGPIHPIVSFSARTDLCRALGLIGENAAAALHELRSLRNQFAHETGPATISDLTIRPILEAFEEETQKSIELLGTSAAEAFVKNLGKADETPQRGMFLMAATLLFGQIRYTEEKISTSDTAQS